MQNCVSMSEVSAKRRKVTRTQVLLEAKSDSSEFTITDLLQRDRNESQEFCDLTITNSYEKIILHRCLFGTTISFFDDLFSGLKIEEPGLLEIEDSNKFQNIKEFVEKFYNGSVVKDDEICVPEKYEEVVGDTDKNALDDFVRHQLNSDRLGLRKFCDVTISTGTRNFPVHKSVLAVQFDYFVKIFTTEMKEKYQSTCHISDVDDEILALVLDFIYTKKIWVNEDMFSDLFAATDYFCMEAFNDELVNCIVGLVSDENCVEMWITGKRFKSEILIQHVEQEICTHILFVISSKQFCNIDQLYIEDFVKLIKEKVSGDQLMQCAVLWMKHDMTKRFRKFGMFYEMIDTTSISQSTWVLLMQTKELMRHNLDAANAVINYTQQFVPSAETELALGTMYVMCQSGDVYSCDMSALKPKTSTNKSVFVPKWSKLKNENKSSKFGQNSTLVYGFQKLFAFVDYDVLSFNESWQNEGRLQTKCVNSAVAFVGDTFYVAGGSYFGNGGLQSYKKSYGNQQTENLASCIYGRSCFALIPHQGYLFAVGHSCLYAKAPIEVYSIVSNTWETLILTGPDVCDVKLSLVHQSRAYIVYGNDTIQVATFDLARRRWVSGVNAETGIVERCASLTLGFPDFASCTMGQPLPKPGVANLYL